MTLLWIGFALLAVVAVAFVVWPLMWSGSAASQEDTRGRSNVELYRQHLDEWSQSLTRGDIDAEQFQQLKLEADRALLEDSDGPSATAAGAGGRFSANTALLAVAAAVPVVALVLYLQLGASEDWAIEQLAIEHQRQTLTARSAGEGLDRERAQALATRLQRRLEARPDNLQNWFLLARTSLELQDYQGAINAYRAIVERDDSASRVLAELAQTLFLAAGNRVTPEVEEYVARTLTLDPGNDMALGLAGIAAFQKTDYRGAIDFWQRALASMAPEAPGAVALVSGIGRARQLMQEAGDAPAAAAGEEAGGLSVRLNVSLDAQITPAAEQVVFVYARAWQGPKMPLAIARFPVADLPREVVLDESMAMAPGMTLASFPQLELVARLSQSGQPTPQPGDWEATRGPVSAVELSGAVELVINTRIP